MHVRATQIAVLLVLSIVGVLSGHAQGLETKSSDWAPVIHLPPPINSDFDDQAAVLSPDGRTMYFSSNRPGSIAGSRDIWISRLNPRNKSWGTPVNAGPAINSSGTELVRSLTTDGRVLLFQSDRSGGSGQADIWVAARENINDDFGWGDPVNLGSTINTPFTELASSLLFDRPANVRKLFFSSNKPSGFGGPDIYESSMTDDGYGPPINVVELNSPSIETCFWIRDDGLEIIFSSNRPDLSEDRSYDDLWRATRRTVFEPWSAPVRLGPNINSAGYQDVAPFVSADGKTLLMSSKRPGGMGAGTFDIYMTTRPSGIR